MSAASAQQVENEDAATAPTDPEPVRLALDLTQVVGGKNPFLCFKLSIRNATLATIQYKSGALALQVAGRRVPTSQPAAKRGSVAIEAGMHANVPADKLRLLSDCEIEPLHTVTGWMCFDLRDFMPVPEGADDFAAHEWLLVGRIGEYVVKFDVAAHEIDTLAIVTRRSKVGGRVHVIEIGRRINALNVGRLLAAIDSIPAAERGYVLYVREQRLLLDHVAGEALLKKTGRGRWGAGHFGGGGDAPDLPQPVVVRADSDFPRSSCALDELSHAKSEVVAVLRVLAEQPNTGAALIGYLTGASSEIRTEAAEGLAKHLDEPGATAALVRATHDSDPDVRIAALWSLAPWQAADDNSAEVAAVVKAMHDVHPKVRMKAAEGAAWTQSERVKQELLRLLDDEAREARFHACHSLRLLKYRPAIPKLKEVMNSRDAMLSGAAIDALIEIGEISRFDGALAKIERQDPSVYDVDAIAESDDPRVVPALIGLLDPKRYGNSSDTVIAHAARALGDRQAQEAVEPLLAALSETDFPVEWMPIVAALGKLGDARAIAPIRKAMRRHPKLDDGLVGYEALLSLKAPGVFEELPGLLKQRTAPAALGPVLEAFARHSDERMVPIIEPYLDREDSCIVAAKAMTYVRSPAALAALKRRLNAADYALGPQLLAGVWRNAEWIDGADGRDLLDAAGQSPNEATRAAVTLNMKRRQPFQPPPRRGRRRR
jgi:HEAT repeat protein